MKDMSRSGGARSLDVEAVTRRGFSHVKNEDAYLVDVDRGLFAVSDGMGGHRDGDLASQAVVDALATVPFEPGQSLDQKLALVVRALVRVSNGLFADYLAAPEQDISGATALCVLVDGDYACCVWAGDSRLYLLRDHHLYLVSEDHSDNGGPLTRAIGAAEHIQIDRRLVTLEPNDVLILCTDGLLKGLDETELANMIEDGTAGLADRLLAKAMAGGSKDDITVVAVWTESDDRG